MYVLFSWENILTKCVLWWQLCMWKYVHFAYGIVWLWRGHYVDNKHSLKQVYATVVEILPRIVKL